MHTFEYDEVKSLSNADKHGIDFIAAQAIWEDPDAMELQAKSYDEERCIVIGLIGDKHWSAVITYRDTNIRLISVRRSRPQEIQLYES